MVFCWDMVLVDFTHIPQDWESCNYHRVVNATVKNMRKYITPSYHIIQYGRRICHKRNKMLFAYMMTSSNGNIHVTGPLWGELSGHRWIPSQRPMTRGFDVFFDPCLNKRLSKVRRWWYKTPSSSLWRHYILYELYSKPVVHQSRALSMGVYIGHRSWYLILSGNRCV